MAIKHVKDFLSEILPHYNNDPVKLEAISRMTVGLNFADAREVVKTLPKKSQFQLITAANDETFFLTVFRHQIYTDRKNSRVSHVKVDSFNNTSGLYVPELL